MATQVNLTDPIQRGDTTPFIFNWDDGAGPMDMRGKTLVMTFKLSPYQVDSDAELTKTVVFAADDVDAEDGITAFNLESSEAALLIPGVTFHYAVRIITPASPEDIELTYFYGTVPVEDA